MNINKWFIMIVMMLALTGFVMAEDNTTTDTGNDNVTQGQALNVRFDNVQCKVAFTNAQIDLLEEYVSINQTANKVKLLEDMTTLKTYVDNVDKSGFDNYTEHILRPDMNNASRDLTNAKKNFKQYNLSNDSKAALISELKNAKNAYVNCTNDKEIKMANVMEIHMENWNRQWGKIIDSMNIKNITMEDAVALQAEIDAKNEELKALIAEGNITKIGDFMQSYYEDQFHFAARFEISRLNGYKNKLAPLAEKYNMSGKINDINKMMKNAEQYASQGHKYNGSEFNTTWENIKDAGKDMKNIAKNISDARILERQGKLAQRQQNADNRQQKMQDRQGRGNGNDNGSGAQ